MRKIYQNKGFPCNVFSRTNTESKIQKNTSQCKYIFVLNVSIGCWISSSEFWVSPKTSKYSRVLIPDILRLEHGYLAFCLFVSLFSFFKSRIFPTIYKIRLNENTTSNYHCFVPLVDERRSSYHSRLVTFWPWSLQLKLSKI